MTTASNKKGEEPLSWRQEEEYNGRKSQVTSQKQHGINPRRFYDEKENIGATGRRRQLQDVLSQAQSSVLDEKKKQVSSMLVLKRSAYKDVTSLRNWPLQDLAMNDLDKLLLKNTNGAITMSEVSPSSKTMPSQPQNSCYSSSSSSSGCSVLEEEPKRTKSCIANEKECLSPRKSTLRNQFRQDFIQERDLPFVAKENKEENYVSDEPAVKSKEESTSSQDEDEQEQASQQQLQRETEVKTEAVSDPTFLPALWCMEPRIFAMENSSGGRRKYIVGHLGRFMDRYWRKTDAKHRHYYELIRQGDPCRLYFDLEFHKASNPEITAELCEELLNELYEELRSEFESVFDIGNVDRSCVVDLDSSTETKFSRHWIVHLPTKALFEDSSAVGRFVKNLVGRLASDAATGVLAETRPTLAKYLFVNVATKKQVNEDETNSSLQQDQTTCFIDLGVYTRNRLFRLLGSSKFGKPASAALRLASTNQFPFPDGFDNQCFYVPDMERKSKGAANENDDDSANKATREDVDMSRFKSSVDWTMHAEALAHTLVVPMNTKRIEFPILPSQLNDVVPVQNISSHPCKHKPRITSMVSASGVEKSPFPLLDEFVLRELGTRGGVEGAIRVWSLDTSNDSNSSTVDRPQSMTYQMCRNRWCERIGRAHKSNNILWTVDLESLSCFQSCHDPECRMMQFRGTPVPIPPTICEHIQDVLFEQQLAAVDETTLLQKKKAAELSERTQEEMDDAAFEEALLNLDISDKDDKPTASEEEHSSAETGIHSSEGEDQLSDSELFEAVLANPELFP